MPRTFTTPHRACVLRMCQLDPNGSLSIHMDNDRHRVAMAYFNRVGWNVKKTKSIVRLATLAAQHGLSGTNGVEDSLRNMSLADMSYGADLVKSMVASSGDIFAARRDFDPLELQGPNRR
jgi:hypothetical protein